MSVVYSRGVEDECFKIKIGSLEGKRPRPNLQQLIDEPHYKFSGIDDKSFADLIIKCILKSESTQLCPPMQTSYKHFSNQWSWNEWIEFPIVIADLPRDTIVVLEIYDSLSPSKTVILGKAFVNVFGNQAIMRTGLYDLKVRFQDELDQICNSDGSITLASLSGQDELDRLYELKSNHYTGQIATIDWLDKLTFSQIEKITHKTKRDSDHMFISVEFPKALINGSIDIPILYHDTVREETQQTTITRGSLNTIYDPELNFENIIESKHHKLSRSTRSCLSDKDLKPNAAVRDQLSAIVSYPPTKLLTSEEQDLIWKFRYYLTNQKKALTKFLKCLNWDAKVEVEIALELLESWQLMDTQDALELLTPQFKHPRVRHYAVSRLRQASDEDLLLYLLQLVQAIKYEDYNLDQKPTDIKRLAPQVKNQYHPRQLSHQEQHRYQQFPGLVLCPKDLQTDLVKTKNPVDESHDPYHRNVDKSDKFPPIEAKIDTEWDLATFLINRCVKNDVLANYFYWYLVVEIENLSQHLEFKGLTSNSTSMASNQMNQMMEYQQYTEIMDRFIQTLSDGGHEYLERRDSLQRQRLFVEKLVGVMAIIGRENKNRLGKIEKLVEVLADSEILNFNFTHLDPPLALPLDPNLKILGVLPEKATLFKSQLMPCRLTFSTTFDKSSVAGDKPTPDILSTSPSQNYAGFDANASSFEYNVIFKNGDDLRQDQLILQNIALMDKLLRRDNLDLKLTPYRVLATSTRHGFVQYIDSQSLAEIRANEGSIQNYFRKHAPAPDAPYGIQPEVMDAYVRSCAGYCVITYLLGVGDRHLDNLLLTKNGKLFHIDFGYILGRDPKPMPPPMKLTREMVEAMGGTSSDQYREFLNLSHTAFLHLRRHSNLILNLFALMVDANVPDIALEPDKTVKKVQDKFRLDLSDEEAVHYIQNLIELSVSDVMAVLVEQIHKIAQYWRK